MKITVNDEKLLDYPLAAEFLNSGTWGRGEAIVAMVERVLSQYGIVPQNREGIRALELWASESVVQPHSLSRAVKVDKQKVKQRKVPKPKKQPPIANDITNTIQDVTNEQPPIVSEVLNDTKPDAIVNQDEVIENENGMVDPFAALGIDMEGIL